MMTAIRPPLPPLLEEIAELTSVDVALRLAREAGGGRLYFPEQPKADSRLVKLVGGKAAAALAKRFAPDRIAIPMARSALTWQEAREMRRRGMPIQQIVRALRVSRRTIEGYVRDIPSTAERPAGRRQRARDTRQSDLFSG